MVVPEVFMGPEEVEEVSLLAVLEERELKV
jgi:hypothetical protein